DFRLILNPSNGLLSPFFKAYTINSIGLKKPVSIQKENFFEGHVFGEKNSDVTVHIDEGMMTASIQTPDETYVVEPAWRHLPDHDNTTMIAYRTSDIKETPESQDGHLRFCGYVRENGNLTVKKEKQDITLVKRQTSSQYRWEPVHTRCSLLLVADHLFYQNMGGSDLKGTINYLISLIDRVNKVYLETEWNSNDKQGGFRGMGFVIQEVMVHTESTPVVHGEVHYNMADYEWNVRDLLENFARHSSPRFCLSHLFTHQGFPNDGTILGLGYIAAVSPHQPGGICSPGVFCCVCF
ncbi:ADAM 17-like protease, partial [Limulus polyphemus]|uniref:ADAM 17-like protease n=1 Tax=Limulus polyphemus TaxID=6850 RepID=A0ABM1RXP4_LIMPO